MVPPSRNTTKKVIDNMESLWDMGIIVQNKNPKGIIESKYSIFGFNHIAHALMGLGLMYFIPHRFLPAPELIEVIKGAFDPVERVVRDLHGRVVLSLVPRAFVATFNPLEPFLIPIPLNWEIRPSTNMRMNILSWINKHSSTNFIELTSSEVLLSNFSSHLQLLLSMLSIVVKEKLDRYISLTKLVIAYRITHPRAPTIYD